MTVYSTTLISPNAQLVKSLSVLKAGLKVISDGRSNDAMNDGKSVADTLWMNRAEQVGFSSRFLSSNLSVTRNFLCLWRA